MAISHAFSNAIPDGTNTNIVRPSDWNSAHNQYLTVTGNTVGQSTFSGSNIVIGGGPNITISGVNATRFDISAGAGGAGDGGVGISAGANSVSAGTVVFSNSNGVTFGLNGSTVTASYTVPTVTNSSWTVSDAASSASVARLAFTNLNGVTLSLSTGAAGSHTIVGSHNALTSQSNQAVSAANGSYAFQTLSFSNVNGISFGTSAGSAITASHNAITTGRASNDGVGLNTAQTNVTWTVNSAGLSLNAVGYAGTGTTFNGANVSGSMTVNSNGVQLSMSAGNYLTSQSNQAVSAANGSYAFQTLSFSNANGVSFGTSAGSAITASHNALTTARASNDAVGLNTAQTNVTWTVNSAGLSLNAAGYAGTGTTFNGANVSGSMTVNSVGVQLSLSAGAGGGGTNLTAYAQSNTVQSSSGTIALSSLNFAGAGIASVGITNGSVVVSVPAGGGAGDGGVFAGVSTGGNTAGSTGTVSTGNFVLVGSNGITLSQSTGAAGSAATVTINGVAPKTFSGSALVPNFAAISTRADSFGQNSVFVQKFVLQEYVSAVAFNVPVFVTNSSSAASSGQKGQTLNIGVYTRHSTNSTVITQHYTTSYTIAASYSSNVSWMLSIATGIGNSTSYNTTTVSSAGLNLSASLHGARELLIPVSSLFTPGEYWIAHHNSTSGAGTVGNVLNIGHQHATLSMAGNRLGISTGVSNNGWHRDQIMGVYSTSTNALPNGISQTQMNVPVFTNNAYIFPMVRLEMYTA